jgi:hypothetical protein
MAYHLSFLARVEGGAALTQRRAKCDKIVGGVNTI